MEAFGITQSMMIQPGSRRHQEQGGKNWQEIELERMWRTEKAGVLLSAYKKQKMYYKS
jgi:hypothetical protein